MKTKEPFWFLLLFLLCFVVIFFFFQERNSEEKFNTNSQKLGVHELQIQVSPGLITCEVMIIYIIQYMNYQYASWSPLWGSCSVAALQ